MKHKSGMLQGKCFESMQRAAYSLLGFEDGGVLNAA